MKRQSRPGATLASKRTLTVWSRTGAPPADPRSGVPREAGHAAEEVVERHGRIGEADHADHDPEADGGGSAQAAGESGIVRRGAHTLTSAG